MFAKRGIWVYNYMYKNRKDKILMNKGIQLGGWG